MSKTRSAVSSKRNILVKNNAPLTSVVRVPETAIKRIVDGDYASACEFLHTLPRSPIIEHTLGVCMMRAGRTAQAVKLFRGMCLHPGTTTIRSDADDILKTNYATAILLAGIPSGAMEILAEVKQQDHPAAVELRSAINRWAAGLPFWRRWDWKLNRIDPPHATVPIDGLPGEFPFVVLTMPTAPVDPKGATKPQNRSPHLAA